ncbi:MAG: PEP-CTERM sorting domain-containing protein [Anaerohalosphaera sp.]|nr:PEP-CTERM sorting domain-containing protein [Anaerohalosphaera sp.]
MISKKMLLSLVVLVLCVPMLSADVVLDEDFDGQAPGTWVNSAWDGTSDKYEVVADTGDIFGAGTDNQVLRLAPMGGVSGSINIPDAAIVTLSFDFYHVAADGGTPFGAIQFQPYGTSKLFKFKLHAGNIKKDNGVIGSYGNAVVHFDLTIDNVANLVTLDVDGVELGSWATYADVDTMNRFAVSCFGSNTVAADPMFIENLTVVPEPATLALLGLGYICTIRRKKA